jgi:hypothetical protein
MQPSSSRRMTRSRARYETEQKEGIRAPEDDRPIQRARAATEAPVRPIVLVIKCGQKRSTIKFVYNQTMYFNLNV